MREYVATLGNGVCVMCTPMKERMNEMLAVKLITETSMTSVRHDERADRPLHVCTDVRVFQNMAKVQEMIDGYNRIARRHGNRLRKRFEVITDEDAKRMLFVAYEYCGEHLCDENCQYSLGKRGCFLYTDTWKELLRCI